MPELSFKVPHDDAEPIAFTVSGTDLIGAEWSERFVCVHPFPVAAAMAFRSAVGLDEDGNRIGDPALMQSLMLTVLREEMVVETPGDDGAVVRTIEQADDFVRFFGLMRDKRRIVPEQTLLDLVIGVFEEASGFPL